MGLVAREAVERARLGQPRGQLLRVGLGREQAHVRHAQRAQAERRRHVRTAAAPLVEDKPQLAPTSPANADEGGIGVAHDVGGDCAPPEGVGGEAKTSSPAAGDVAAAIDTMAEASGWAVRANMTDTKASRRPRSACENTSAYIGDGPAIRGVWTATWGNRSAACSLQREGVGRPSNRAGSRRNSCHDEGGS